MLILVRDSLPYGRTAEGTKTPAAKHILTHVGIAVGAPGGPINDVQLLQREAQGACQRLNLLPACESLKLHHAQHRKIGTTTEAGQ